MLVRKLLHDLARHVYYLELSKLPKKHRLTIHIKLIREYLDTLGGLLHILPNPYYLPTEDIFMAKNLNWHMVNCRLTAEDEKPLAKLMTDLDYNPATALIEILTQGYKVSLSWVDSSNSFVFSVTGNDRSPRNNGKTLSSWSDDAVEAMFMGLYKVNIKYNKGDWTDDSRGSNWG